MRCLLAVLSAALLCACVLANPNPIDLGPLHVHARTGDMTPRYKPNDNDTIASKNARVAAERLRPYFPTGLGHIPRLDPYLRAKPIDVNINRSDFNCAITLSEIEVHGAMQFVLTASEIYTATHRTDFIIQFPELKMSFNYNVRLHSDEATAALSGHANMTFQHVFARLAYSVEEMLGKESPIVGSFFKVVGMDFYAWADDIQYDLQNLIRPRRSVPASKLTWNVIKDVKDEVALAFVNGMVQDLDDMFTKYTVDQIMKLLLP